MAQWTFRASSAVTAGNASGGALAVNAPVGLASGDLIVYSVYWEGDSQSITLPSGFTWLRTPEVRTTTTPDFLVGLCAKIAGGSEGSTYTFTPSVGSQWRTIVGGAYSGGTGALTVDVSSARQGNDIATNTYATELTTTGVNRLLLFGRGSIQGDTATGTAQGAGGSGTFASNLRVELGGTVLADAALTTAQTSGRTAPTGVGTEDFISVHVAVISDSAAATTADDKPALERGLARGFSRGLS